MYLVRFACVLIITSIAVTIVSCSKGPLPCIATTPQPTSSLLNKVEQDPFNYVLLQYATDSLVDRSKRKVNVCKKELS